MTKRICIYVDEGASLAAVVRAVAQEVDVDYVVQVVVAEHLDCDEFFDGLDVFVMPGGADLPYCKKLNGERNERLRKWVEGGGVYLGLCAGAYYGCREIVFNGHRERVVGKRELGFLRGKAVGSIKELAPLYDGTLKSAAVVNLVMDEGSVMGSFYHGGPFFEFDDEDGVSVLASYETLDKPAIVECVVGKGRALLCGVHPEVSHGGVSSVGIALKLRRVESARRKLWRGLLTSCGVKLRSLQ